MRFPSLNLVVEEAGAAFARFPLVLVCAFVATAASMLALEWSAQQALLFRIILVSSLGMPLFVAFAASAQRLGLSRAQLALLRLFGAAILTVLLIAWQQWTQPAGLRRYVQFSLGAHLLAAFLPYLRAGESNGFWQYNRTLFQRFLISLLFSMVLFVGLAVAMAALTALFGADIEASSYLRLLFIILFVFHTWYFLGGIPDDLALLQYDLRYPKGLKIFSQYILLPIVVVYLAILTAYMGKVAVTREWPSGWIGYLVTSVAVLGILSLLLVQPIQERAENRWVKTYGRWFYIALLPSIGMLLMAIFKRINQYGITENRYFLVALAVWLAGVAGYFVVSRSRNIKVIPISLCVVALLTSCGPWGAYSVSRRSQVGRLQQLFEQAGAMQGSLIAPVTQAVDFETRREISNILTYLIYTHHLRSIAPWFGGQEGLAQIDTLATSGRTLNDGNARNRAALILKHFGMTYVQRWEATPSKHFSYRSVGRPRPVSIAGYDYALEHRQPLPLTFTLNQLRYQFRLGKEKKALQLWLVGPSVVTERLVLDMPLRPLHQRIVAQRQESVLDPHVFDETVLLEARNDSVAVLVEIENVSGRFENDVVEILHLQGNYFLSGLAAR